MGIPGLYGEIKPVQRVALSKLALDKFEQTGRPLRIAVDVSIWLFQILSGKGGTNPGVRTFYYRLLRLIACSVHPIFVFDGTNLPPKKRGKNTSAGRHTVSLDKTLAKDLLKFFGFPIHQAPGEAEAECALLQREGIVDAVLTEDVDAIMFGSGVTIRDWSPELKSSKTPTHVTVYDAIEIRNEVGLDREGMILVALMRGGDYAPEGIPGCGVKIACEAARAGFGKDLCHLRRGDITAISAWREKLKHELKSNHSKFFGSKHPSMKIPEDWPQPDILGYYTHPVVSTRENLNSLKQSIRWDQKVDFPRLREFTHRYFEWHKLEGAKHFIRSLAPSFLVRELRMEAGPAGFVTDDLLAREKHESLLVKGIHGKRQHAVTDLTPELRVSFIPIELVKINLDEEDDDDNEPDAPTQEPTFQRGFHDERAFDVDLDEELGLESEDADEGPRKRGPTKFDPSKPARAWVAETFVQVGVPLKFEDWRAGLNKTKKTGTRAKRTTSTKETTNATIKVTRGRAQKTTTSGSQSLMNSYAKVTKPGVKRPQVIATTKEPLPNPCSSRRPATISLLSPSPVKSISTAAPQRARKDTLPPVLEELPSSVTKRRRRGPIQRSYTLPADLSTDTSRPKTPPPLGLIETLDLVDSPVLPSPSELPSKKAKMQTRRDPMTSRNKGEKFAASVQENPKQMTLDSWTTPTKTRRPSPLPLDPLIASPSVLRSKSAEIETLDLTRSSPPGCDLAPKTTNARRINPTTKSRQPLKSINSNTTFSSSSSANSTNPPAAALSAKQTSTSRLQSKSPLIDTLDLTELISSPLTFPAPALAPTSTTSPSPKPSAPASPDTTPFSSELDTIPISLDPDDTLPIPDSETESQSRLSPPAAGPWKQHTKKKRAIEIRKSLAGSWAFVEASSSPIHVDDAAKAAAGAAFPKGKARRRWRESEIEVLDLT
ncbi:flap structure-specific endonuclease [Dendryphion nanum]|uniref:Flap structure-specific endonuclease n=1 Tax=Dendryphion nanum TaxID=256645 RepID=A0A9P9EDY9_9PLEO|nr:flap structure-specific endonuclease [Dendryphion nanum]